MSATIQLSRRAARPDVAELAIAIVSGLALALTALFLCVVPFAGHMAGSRDFVAYWATGQQLRRHADPYDMVAMMQIEHAAGLDVRGVLLMRNPPWALPLAIPLGFLGLRVASVLWSLVLLGCLLLSVRMLWLMHGRPPGSLHWLALAFTPALVCLIMGQTSLFALLGLVLFLRFYRAQPFLAGVCLWLCTLKPHLFLPFAAVLLVWMIYTRSYGVLVGAVVAVGASCLVTSAMDPAAWQHYFQLMHAPATENEYIPCLADFIRLNVRRDAVWLQYCPAMLSCIWAISYYWSRRERWDWMREGSLVMLVSLLSAPYCWIYDQGLAIPGLLQGIYRTGARTQIVVLAALSVILDTELCCVKITSSLYLWPAAAWVLWYLWACASAENKSGVPSV